MADKTCKCGITIPSNSTRWRAGVCWWCETGQPAVTEVTEEPTLGPSCLWIAGRCCCSQCTPDRACYAYRDCFPAIA